MRFNKVYALLLWSLVACQGEKGQLFTQIDRPQLVLADSLDLMPNVGQVYHQGQAFTGTSVAFFPNGKEAVTIEYVNGKKHGMYKKWFEHGRESYVCPYQDGRRHGTAYSWWSNGNIRSESSYKHGVPHGMQKQWYVSGVLFKKMNLKDGKEDGLQQSWRENGKLYNNYEAKNGRTFGLKRAKLCYGLKDETIQISAP